MPGPETGDLQGYADVDTLRAYDANRDSDAEPSNLTRYHSLWKLLPPMTGRVVLDLPCGTGEDVIRLLDGGAKRVIAADIVAEQVDFARDKLAPLGHDARIGWHVHDATEVRCLEAPADIALCVHLFCFARTRSALGAMARCLAANLVPGGVAYITACGLHRNPEVASGIRDFGYEVVRMDPWLGPERPRRMELRFGSFDYRSWVWSLDTITEALGEAGFSTVERVPFSVAPGAPDGLQRYVEVIDGHTLVATRARDGGTASPPR